jgi:hypothetical protein
MTEIAMSAAKRKFKPEFLNRLDNIVMFNTLTPADLVDILQIELDKLRAQIITTSRVVFDLEVSPAAKSKLLAEGYDKRYNARNLRRVVEQRVAQPLGSLVATAQIHNNDVVIVDYREGQWEYYAKTADAKGASQASVPKGQLSVPMLRKSDVASSASSDVSKSRGWPLFDELNHPVCNLPSENP